jgi:uncharacterized protein YjbI with pentapeptide repeats
MTRPEFFDTSFKNCDFLAVNLATSLFFNCKFERTKFIESDLTAISVSNFEILKSNQWFKIDNFSVFDKPLDN